MAIRDLKTKGNKVAARDFIDRMRKEIGFDDYSQKKYDELTTELIDINSKIKKLRDDIKTIEDSEKKYNFQIELAESIIKEKILIYERALTLQIIRLENDYDNDRGYYGAFASTKKKNKIHKLTIERKYYSDLLESISFLKKDLLKNDALSDSYYIIREYLYQLALSSYSSVVKEINDKELIELINNPSNELTSIVDRIGEDLFEPLKKDLKESIKKYNLNEANKRLKKNITQNQQFSEESFKDLINVFSEAISRCNMKIFNSIKDDEPELVVCNLKDKNANVNYVESLIEKAYEIDDQKLYELLPNIDKKMASEALNKLYALDIYYNYILEIKSKLHDSFEVCHITYKIDSVVDEINKIIDHIDKLKEKYQNQLTESNFALYEKALEAALKCQSSSLILHKSIEKDVDVEEVGNNYAKNYNIVREIASNTGKEFDSSKEEKENTSEEPISSSLLNDNMRDLYKKIIDNIVAYRSQYVIMVTNGLDITFKEFCQHKGEKDIVVIEEYKEKLLKYAFDLYIESLSNLSFSKYVKINLELKKLLSDFVSDFELEQYEKDNKNTKIYN